MAYEKPNYTQTPNAFFDNHLRDIKSLAELKVTLIVLRNTMGWHAKEIELTIAEIMTSTGLSNRHVVRGIALALERGTISRRSIITATGKTFAYEANISNSGSVTKGHKPKGWVSDQRSHQKVTESSAVFNIDLKKEKERDPVYAIQELKDPDFIPGLRNQLSIYKHVPFDEAYRAWYSKYEPMGGIGRRPGSKCTLAQYAARIESYFQTWERNAKARNGHKQTEDESDYHSLLVAPEKPVDYFEKQWAEANGR